MTPIRLLLVDDSPLIRKLLSKILGLDPMIEVAATATNGREALDVIDDVDPDLVVLDVEMPVMDGLTTLPLLKRRRPDIPVVMFSTLTASGASATLDALTGGADDYVTKPSNTGSFARTAEEVRDELAPRIKALVARRRRMGAPVVRRATPDGSSRPVEDVAPSPSPSGPTAGRVPTGPSTSPTSPSSASADRPARAIPSRTAFSAVPATPARVQAPVPMAVTLEPTGLRPEAIVIAVSTGGPDALHRLLPAIPSSLSVPILIVQHMPALFTRMLAERLDKVCALSVREGVHGATPRGGEVWLAPGGSHMVLARVSGTVQIILADGPPVQSCKPAADPLFESAARVHGSRVLGVVLTGMGSDGLGGARVVRAAGGTVICQDESSSVVWGMPGAVTEAGLAHHVIPLDQLAGALTGLVSPIPTRPLVAPAT